MSVDILPTEILIKIFTYVSKIDIFASLVAIPSVNQRWRYISKYYLHHIDIRLSQLEKTANKKLFLYKFLNNINGVENIYFDCFFDLKYEFWYLFKDKFKNLKKIDFSNYNRHIFGLNFNLVNICPNLETIVFSSFMWINIMDLHLFKNLKKIKIPYNVKNDFNDYKKMFSHNLNSLHSLNLKDCKDLNLVNLEFIGKNCPNLIFLDIRGCENCLDKYLLNNYFHKLKIYKFFSDYDDIFDVLIEKNIEYIYVEEYYYLTKIYNIKKGSYNLKSLSITDSNINDFFIDKLIKICPFIEKLSFDNCHSISDDSLVNIINKIINLKTLKINACENIVFKNNNKIISKKNNIEHINFDYMNYVRCFSNIIKFLPNLKKLSIEYTLNNVNIINYLTSNLHYLNIPGILYNEKQYNILCQNCPNLIFINNNDNVNFNKKCFDIIMDKCKYINYLYLKRIKPLEFDYVIEKIYHKNILKWNIEVKNYDLRLKKYTQMYPNFEKNVMNTWCRNYYNNF